MAIVQAAQNATVLIRELQELWLFGGLDTLKEGEGGKHGGKEEEVMEVVRGVEGLARGRVDVGREAEGEAEVKVESGA